MADVDQDLPDEAKWCSQASTDSMPSDECSSPSGDLAESLNNLAISRPTNSPGTCCDTKPESPTGDHIPPEGIKASFVVTETETVTETVSSPESNSDQLSRATDSGFYLKPPEPESLLHVDADNLPECPAQSDLVPSSPDFFMSYATLPGCLSYRHVELGSVYVNALSEQIKQFKQTLSLDHILMKVTETVRNQMEKIYPKEINERQFPFHLHTTEKLIYLK